MTNDLGRRIKTAAPSTPVSITGLNEALWAGDHFAVYEDEKQPVQLVKNCKTCSYEATSTNTPC